MKDDIQFHCSLEGNFRTREEKVRGFIYKDYSIPLHTHDFYEINIINAGSGIHTIKDASFEVRAGDVFVIPPKISHAYTDTERLDVFHILLHPEFIGGNYDEASKVKGFLQLIEIEPFLRSMSRDSFFLHLTSNQLSELHDFLRFIVDSGMYDKPELMLLKHHETWKILYWFSYLLDAKLDSDVNKNPYEQQILHALEYIHFNFSEKITIESLCSKTYLSRSTLLRNFKQICGCTPLEYLNNYRIQKAINMLKEKKYSKTYVAQSCGFYDLSHMERIMKSKGKH